MWAEAKTGIPVDSVAIEHLTNVKTIIDTILAAEPISLPPVSQEDFDNWVMSNIEFFTQRNLDLPDAYNASLKVGAGDTTPNYAVEDAFDTYFGAFADDQEQLAETVTDPTIINPDMLEMRSFLEDAANLPGPQAYLKTHYLYDVSHFAAVNWQIAVPEISENYPFNLTNTLNTQNTVSDVATAVRTSR